MFIFAWAAEVFLHACTHAHYSNGNCVIASAAALEQQVDSVGACLGYQLQSKQKETIISYTSGKDTLLCYKLAMAKASFTVVCLWSLTPFKDWCLVLGGVST